MAEAVKRDVMTTPEAADYLRVKPGTMKRWRADKKGPGWHRLGGRRVRYMVADLDAYLQRGKPQ